MFSVLKLECVTESKIYNAFLIQPHVGSASLGTSEEKNEFVFSANLNGQLVPLKSGNVILCDHSSTLYKILPFNYSNSLVYDTAKAYLEKHNLTPSNLHQFLKP